MYIVTAHEFEGYFLRPIFQTNQMKVENIYSAFILHSLNIGCKNIFCLQPMFQQGMAEKLYLQAVPNYRWVPFWQHDDNQKYQRLC